MNSKRHYEWIKVSPVAGFIGAEVEGVDLTKELEQGIVREIACALVDYEVIFFRNQNISPIDHCRFGRYFGELSTHQVLPHLEGYKEIVVLDSEGSHPPVEEWHTDVTFEETPPLGSVLHCKIAPPFGGNTLWASMSAAYESLSSKMQQFLDGLIAEHSFVQGYRHTLRQPGAYEKYRDVIAQNPPVQHPVVRTHPVTGRKCLFVNGLFTTRILGLSEMESRSVLDFLYQHIVEPEHTCRFVWQNDSVAFWDNRSTQHRPVNDFAPARRRMQRIVIKGDRPF